MPWPMVEPSPWPSREWRLLVPLLAHEASYLAASASTASLDERSIKSGQTILRIHTLLGGSPDAQGTTLDLHQTGLLLQRGSWLFCLLAPGGDELLDLA